MSQITTLLSEEHQEVLRRLKRLEAGLEPYDEGVVKETVQFFEEQLVLHRRKEEEILFPILGRHIGTDGGPIHCMLEEHSIEKKYIDIIRTALADGGSGMQERIVEAAQGILSLLPDHIAKEDGVLYPLAERTLSEAEKTEMKGAMDAIGYCCETPASSG